MEKTYDHSKVEGSIYKNWEEKGYFTPEIHPNGKPYAIILPPPNANGALHFGHAMFTIEDILIRYHRMKGDAALWLPGTDHAGTETQFVFEKKLQEEGKSRFDFTREDLYKRIWEYVAQNRGGIESQLRKLGFSLDWSRQKFTLDKDIVEIVIDTFKKMYKDGLVYRDYRLVNYCTKDGTSFSDLEVINEQTEGTLYHVRYVLKGAGDTKHITIATTRPETMFGDVAIMVNPQDARYKQLIGKTALIPLINKEIPIIADAYVDMVFGTGAVKVTPLHDFNDYEIAKKHKLPMDIMVTGFDGKMQHTHGIVDGLYVKQARTKIVEALTQKDLLEEAKTHQMVLRKCYKCKTVLEPLPLEQWYVKVGPLIANTVQALDKKYVNIYPQNFEHILKQWYDGLRDWNISRQNVWGIQIPVWYEADSPKDFAVAFIDSKNIHYSGNLEEFLQQGFSLAEIEKGLQKVMAPISAKVVFEEEKEKDKHYLPETDTFDTWFSSGQWPYVTLKTTKPGDFEKFYPTAVMETGYDILKAWVSRMLMLGLYVANGSAKQSKEKLKDTVPFRDVVLHGLVNDPYGKKMSKSKGNVVNPLELVDQYGADAVRFALVYGNATGNDQVLSYTKLDGARKFANKLWNMARFIQMNREEASNTQLVNLEEVKSVAQTATDKEWVGKVEELTKEVTKYIDSYQFNLAAERLYEFIWHEFADIYIEDVKKRIDTHSFTVLSSLFAIQLKLLHPFMPFITEEIYQTMLPRHGESIMIEAWPKTK